MSAPAAGLVEQARQALQQRDPSRALALLEAAERAAPSAQVFLDKALAFRMLARTEAAIEALRGALALEPKNFLALLSMGAALEAAGRGREALHPYRAALEVAPPESVLPPQLAAALRQARDFVERSAADIARFLRTRIEDVRARHADENLARFEEGLEIFAGVRRAHVQQPLLFHFPRLPPIPFHERAAFPWLDRLEAASERIAAEFLAVRAQASEAFAPYIRFPAGAPVNQWAELNHSRRWSTFFLWLNGVRQEEACALCPATAGILAELPMADQPGQAPTAMFSVLDARAHIPPHTGSTNTRLVVHLPLVLPGRAWFRVGNETRQWRLGEAWVFDDTIEHEAMNEADEERAILIFDVWNPLLTSAERELVSAMFVARRAWDEQPA